ncbi:MAG: hypothetical protein JXR25_12490 [Pontiellaceae bacterium]|nr:hypothetical protein [Pontiellaceae bacterium]MBN2785634.1 hypothetical protein [Pontiellaceae bacterium]
MIRSIHRLQTATLPKRKTLKQSPSFFGWTVVAVVLLNLHSRAGETYEWPEYAPTIAYDYQDEFETLTPPTNVLDDVSGVAGTYADGRIEPNGATSVKDGKEQVFTFISETGYVVDQVILNGFPIGTLQQYTFRDVHGDHSIAVTFKQEP